MKPIARTALAPLTAAPSGPTGCRAPRVGDTLLTRVRAALAGRYAIDDEIGRGGMGVVYVADDLRHRRRVAVKVLLPHLASALGTARFRREIEIAAGLVHPHILPLHDSGEADGLAYYVTPFIAGESLEVRLAREQRLPLEDALAIARDVATALSHAHRQGIVHRDVKPGNILLAAGHALVADFGIARAVAPADRTDPDPGEGTPPYASPEQGGRGGDVSPRSDIYSLGCVAYEMLAGEPPAPPEGYAAPVSRSLTRLRPGVPRAVARAIERALQRLPADRFASVSQFAEALAHAAGRRGVRQTLRIRLRISVVWA